MRTVEDDTGRRYVLIKESGDASLVRDPTTGERRYVENDRLAPVEGASPLALAARAVPEPARRAVTAARDERALGVLVELSRRGPLAVRTVLADYDLCESDVHGVFGEFRAAGLVEAEDVGGERGYELTPRGQEAVELLTGE